MSDDLQSAQAAGSPETNGQPADGAQDTHKDDQLKEIHALKSDLGRVKKAVESIDGLREAQQQTSAYLEQIAGMITSQQQPPENEYQYGGDYQDSGSTTDDDPLILNQKEFDRRVEARFNNLLENRQKKEHERTTAYRNEYMQSINTMGHNAKSSGNEDEHSAALEHMKSNPAFQQRYTGNGKTDAMINYQAAMNAVLRSSLKPKEGDIVPPGDKPKPGGQFGTQNEVLRQSNLPRLDKYAKEFAREMNWTEEEAQRFLAEPEIEME